MPENRILSNPRELNKNEFGGEIAIWLIAISHSLYPGRRARFAN
jgi:hypothetical protein